jgi:hypothetical protein
MRGKDHRERGVGASIGWVQRDGALEVRDRCDEIRGRRALEMLPALQELVIGFRHGGLVLARQSLLLAGRQRQSQGIDHALCYAVLEDEDVGPRTVILFGP